MVQGTITVKQGDSKLFILFLGAEEWYEFNGTLEEAIRDIKRDRRYCNYGRTGAIIVRGEVLYQVQNEEVEKLFI